MHRLTSWIFRILDAANVLLALAMLATTIVVVFMAAASRYVFSSPIAWTEEIARFAFIWLAFLGIAICERYNAHFRIGYFVDLLPRSPRRGVLVFNELVVFAVLAALLVEGVRFTAVGAGGLSTVTEIPLNYIYMALPIAVALSIVNRARRLAVEGLPAPDAELVDAASSAPRGPLL